MTPSKIIFEYMRVYFDEALPVTRTYEKAYERAADKFERIHGMPCPLSYAGYRRKTYRDKENKRK